MQKVLLTYLFFGLTLTNVSAVEPLTWQKVFQMIAERFPNVPEITVPELVQLQKKHTPMYIIDARDKKEFQISHIQHAINLSQLADVQTKVPEKNTLLIVYCSVGWRSAALVTELRAAGYQNSFNLKGSIFEWVNSGYKVYQNEKITHLVHPFNKKWGVLLKKKYHYEKKWLWW